MKQRLPFLELTYGFLTYTVTDPLEMQLDPLGISVLPSVKYLKTKKGFQDSNYGIFKSELLWPIPWNSMESDLGCTLRIYFDNVTLSSHNVTLTSQKPCQHNNKCDCSKTKCYKCEGYDLLIKYRYSDIFLKNHNLIYSVDKTFQVI